MSSDGFQYPAAASMWKLSPVAGSFGGRGLYWASAGAAAPRTTASATSVRAYRRAGTSFSIKKQFSKRSIGRVGGLHHYTTRMASQVPGTEEFAPDRSSLTPP